MTEQSSSTSLASPTVSECDVRLIGGGPAGAMASAMNFKRSWQAMRLRKANIRVVEGLAPAAR